MVQVNSHLGLKYIQRALCFVRCTPPLLQLATTMKGSFMRNPNFLIVAIQSSRLNRYYGSLISV